MSDTPKISLAYAAGFIDGDGSVLVQSPDDILVHATNTRRKALEPFVPAFGGNIGPPYSNPKKPHHAPVYRWVKSVDRHGSFLKELEPHLLLKQRQARIGLELVARKIVDAHQEFLGWGKGSVGMSQQERGERQGLADKIGWLNAQSCNCPHDGTPSLEYLAGFFDAEGCVGVYRYKANAYRIQVNVSNRCRWILEQYKAIFGGCVGVGHGGFQWQAKHRIAERFVQTIAPSLVLKYERAINALELYRHVGVNNGWGVREQGVDAVIATKAIANELNRKGI